MLQADAHKCVLAFFDRRLVFRPSTGAPKCGAPTLIDTDFMGVEIMVVNHNLNQIIGNYPLPLSIYDQIMDTYPYLHTYNNLVSLGIDPNNLLEKPFGL